MALLQGLRRWGGGAWRVCVASVAQRQQVSAPRISLVNHVRRCLAKGPTPIYDADGSYIDQWGYRIYPGMHPTDLPPLARHGIKDKRHSVEFFNERIVHAIELGRPDNADRWLVRMQDEYVSKPVERVWGVR